MFENKLFWVLFFLIHPWTIWQCNSGREVARSIPEAEPMHLPADSLHTPEEGPATLRVGAARVDRWLPKLADKRVGLVANQSSRVEATHLLDTMLALGVDVRKIFVPEHGFRGTGDAGEVIKSDLDERTGLPIRSLYGKRKKPNPEDLEGLDLLVFDLQDVGARFFTYISTLHYVMEACAEQGLPLMVLDRPNPNGHFVDGPVRQPAFESFVGKHPIPVVHGLTVGELAGMIQGEGWLAGGVRCALEVIPCAGYDHRTFYELPVRPSPNLPNMRAVYLYPSLCFFEGTVVSVGRGTDFPFQVYGSPDFPETGFLFIPAARTGASSPLYENEICKGFDLRALSDSDLRITSRIDLSYLLHFYAAYRRKDQFFRADGFFDLLAGTEALRRQIEEGWTEEAIRASWKEDLEAYKVTRSKYLLYADFE